MPNANSLVIRVYTDKPAVIKFKYPIENSSSLSYLCTQSQRLSKPALKTINKGMIHQTLSPHACGFLETLAMNFTIFVPLTNDATHQY